MADYEKFCEERCVAIESLIEVYMEQVKKIKELKNIIETLESSMQDCVEDALSSRSRYGV